MFTVPAKKKPQCYRFQSTKFWRFSSSPSDHEVMAAERVFMGSKNGSLLQTFKMVIKRSPQIKTSYFHICDITFTFLWGKVIYSW